VRRHRAPGLAEPFVSYWSASGKLLRTRGPGGGGGLVVRYGEEGLITTMAHGKARTDFARYSDGRVRRVQHVSSPSVKGEFTMTTTRTPDEEGILSDISLTFNAKSGLAGARFILSAKPGGDPALAVLKGRVGGHELQPVGVRHIWGPELLRAKSKEMSSRPGLFVVQMHSLNGTTFSDGRATFFSSDSTKSLMISGTQVYAADLTLDACHGKIAAVRSKIHRKNGSLRQSLRYRYGPDGFLTKATGSSGEWEFRYDRDGRLVEAVGAEKNPRFAYDEGGRLTSYNGQIRRFDERGRLILDHRNAAMDWGPTNRLNSVTLANRKTISYLYDHLERLIAKRVDNETEQYFFGDPRKPYLVTHTLRPRSGALTSLAYGHDDKLIFAESGGRRVYVASDAAGSPVAFLGENGDVLREISFDPFGAVSYDSDAMGDFGMVPVGFAGGIVDAEAGLVHFQVMAVPSYRKREHGRQGVMEPKARRTVNIERWEGEREDQREDLLTSQKFHERPLKWLL